MQTVSSKVKYVCISCQHLLQVYKNLSSQIVSIHNKMNEHFKSSFIIIIIILNRISPAAFAGTN